MLKINLADEKGKPGKNAAETPPEPEVETPEPEREPREPKSGGGRNLLMPVAVLLLLAALLVFVWTQWDGIMGFFVAEAPPPPAAPPQMVAPEPEPEPIVEPDPVFVIINDISSVLPPRAWLSQFVVSYNGGYEIKGMAFEHGAMITLGSVLESLGMMSDSVIPVQSSSAETVYPFSFTGSIDDFPSPDILDIIPADMLITQCGSVRDNSSEYDVEFTRFPVPGANYSGMDLPFELVGSYAGLKRVIAELCPDDSANRVYRLVVRSDTPGRVFDRVRAAFSIRRASSI